MSVSESRLMCTMGESQLASYLEGDLPSGETAAMEAHITGCTACGMLLRDLRLIATGAALLPPLSPSRDLWPGIESRLNRTVTSLTEHSSRVSASHLSTSHVLASHAPASRVAASRGSRTFSFLQIAAAALIFATVGSGATYLAMQSVNPKRPAATPDVAVTPDRGDAMSGNLPAKGDQEASNDPASVSDSNVKRALVAYNGASVDVIYEHEIRALRGIVDKRLGELDPKTVAEIRRNIAIIDKAISDSRNALAADPRSRFLSEQLDRTLEIKLSTLRKVALL